MSMQIKDITLDDIRRGKNWRIPLLKSGSLPDVPLEELPVEDTDEFMPDDMIVYTSIFVTDSGTVKPLVVIREVGSLEYNGDQCEYVDGRWRQSGLIPDPDAPMGTEYFANPLEQDPSFISDDDYRQWHRDGFRQFISRL
jgi:hypothetical protein